MWEFKIFLPLYDGISNIEVGIDSKSIIEKPIRNGNKPIIFYGTRSRKGLCFSCRNGIYQCYFKEIEFCCINFVDQKFFWGLSNTLKVLSQFEKFFIQGRCQNKIDVLYVLICSSWLFFFCNRLCQWLISEQEQQNLLLQYHNPNHLGNLYARNLELLIVAVNKTLGYWKNYRTTKQMLFSNLPWG